MKWSRCTGPPDTKNPGLGHAEAGIPVCAIGSGGGTGVCADGPRASATWADPWQVPGPDRRTRGRSGTGIRPFPPSGILREVTTLLPSHGESTLRPRSAPRLPSSPARSGRKPCRFSGLLRPWGPQETASTRRTCRLWALSSDPDAVFLGVSVDLMPLLAHSLWGRMSRLSSPFGVAGKVVAPVGWSRFWPYLAARSWAPVPTASRPDKYDSGTRSADEECGRVLLKSGWRGSAQPSGGLGRAGRA